MIDWNFIATLCIIFAASLFGAWLHSRRRDACLAAFDDFHVTLELTEKRRVWGAMEVLPTGLELHYRNAVQDEEHLESSFLLYGDEFTQIQTIFRYADDLSPDKRKQREQAIRRSFHPNPIRKLNRKTRNFISAGSASLNDILGLVIGRVQGSAGRFIDETSEAHLKQLGDDVIGHVGLETDPLLERLIGTKIVFETVEEGVVHEHVGIFKEYTRDFYEILDVQFPCQEIIPVAQQTSQALAGVRVSAEDDVVTVKNSSPSPIMLLSLKSGEQEQFLDVVVDPNGEVAIHSEHAFTQAVLHARLIRELDMVIPRTRAIIRHRAEIDNHAKLTDIIFDIGMRLPLGDGNEHKIAELQAKLQKNPNDACTMSVLGSLFLQQKDMEKAEALLSKAYEMRFSLPDNGRGVMLHLKELQRRRKHENSLRQKRPPLTTNDVAIPVQDSADTESRDHQSAMA